MIGSSGGGNFISYFSYYCDRTLDSSNFRKGGSTLTHSLGCRSPGGRSMWLTHCTHSEEERDKCLCPAQSRVPAHGMALVTFGEGGLSQMKPILEVPHGPLRALSLRRFKSVPLTATAFFVRVAACGGNSTKCFPSTTSFHPHPSPIQWIQ